MDSNTRYTRYRLRRYPSRRFQLPRWPLLIPSASASLSGAFHFSFSAFSSQRVLALALTLSRALAGTRANTLNRAK